MVLLQPKLHLKVSQRQILTPGLVQMVSVLALNKLELKDMINTEMVENPVLEELEDSVPLLDEVGLASAAEWFVEGFSKRTGIHVNFEVEGEKRRLGQATELTLFRVLQESLTNIHRHAKASAAEVVLRFDGNQVGLRVHDYGVGISKGKLEEFDGNGAHLGLGLTGMKNRVQDQQGQFRIVSTGSGTTVQVELPTV